VILSLTDPLGREHHQQRLEDDRHQSVMLLSLSGALGSSVSIFNVFKR
jgi:hypothetical protein